MKKRFTEEQIIGFLREAESGLPVAELCQWHGFSEAGYYLWRSKFGGISLSDAKRLKVLETENGRLKRPLADALLENEVTKEALKKVESAPARRELMRHMASCGLSERRSLRVIGVSASALRYEPACDHHCALKEKIIALAQRHRRYGGGMIYLKLRQAGEIVNTCTGNMDHLNQMLAFSAPMHQTKEFTTEKGKLEALGRNSGMGANKLSELARTPHRSSSMQHRKRQIREGLALSIGALNERPSAELP